MNLILRLYIPLLMLIVMPVIQMIWSKQRVVNKTSMPIGVIAIVCLFGGIVSSVGATLLAVSSLPVPADGGPRCVTGIEGFAVLGTFISLVTAPVIAIIYDIVYKKRNGYLMTNKNIEVV